MRVTSKATPAQIRMIGLLCDRTEDLHVRVNKDLPNSKLIDRISDELLPQINKFLEDWRTEEDLESFRYTYLIICVHYCHIGKQKLLILSSCGLSAPHRKPSNV
jgi:hypothetical protein